jgi:hypothetical protein
MLSFNTILHLFLDALQIKWTNGVHFLAPFSWKLINFGFFWPESLPTYILTVIGLIYVLGNWQRSIRLSPGVVPQFFKKVVLLIILTVAYFIIPFFLTHGPETANNHYLKTLRNLQERPGQYVEFDRARYFSDSSGDFLQGFASETFRVNRLKLNRSATVSIRGRFSSENEIEVFDVHVHSDWFRDTASYAGLAFITLIWILAFRRYYWRKTSNQVRGNA